ncbi:MAG: SIMPL domain-containing protein [Candidatus Nanoarchaeia archaeon]
MALEKSTFIFIITLILAVGLVAVTFVKPNVVSVNPSEEPKTIDVWADGKASADPDLADIYVTVETRATTADEAQSQNAKIVNDLRLALTATGLTKDITTTSFNLWPEYSYAEEKPLLVDYVVTHSLKINTEKVVAVGKILDVATTSGATRIEYVQFSLSDKKIEELKKQALEKALQKAKDKAKFIAFAAGVSLGRVVHISETTGYYPSIYTREKITASEEVPTQIIAGQIEVTATVAVSYAIE